MVLQCHQYGITEINKGKYHFPKNSCFRHSTNSWVSYEFSVIDWSTIIIAKLLAISCYIVPCDDRTPLYHDEPTARSIHCGDVIMGAIASQITSLTFVYSTVYSDADQRKQQSSASLAFVWGIHRELVNSLHKWPVMRKMFPFDDIIMLGLFSWSPFH